MAIERAGRRAFRVSWDGTAGVTAGDTQGEARANAYRAAREVYGGAVRYTDVRCTRAPEHDGWAAADRSGRVLCPEYVPAAPAGGAA